MTTKGGGSGFDADKFHKLVAMLDSDYVEEASTAFRLAHDQLKRSQRRFCDRLIDSDEARELAEIECAKVRDELTRILDLCASRQTDVDDAQEIIDQLHERIAEMERKARAKAKKYTRKESTTDWEAVATAPEETDVDSSEDWDNAPPPPITPTREQASEHGPAYRLPALPVWQATYWLVLLCFVFLYACAASSRGHMLTVEEWQADNLTIIGGAFLFALVISLYVMGWKWGFSQTRFGQWCVRNAGSVREMLTGLLFLDFAGTMAYIFGVPYGFAEFDEIYLGLAVPLMLVVFVFYFGRLMRKFGWMGVGIKAALLVDAICISITIMNGDLPWWTDSHHHIPISPERGLDAIYFLIGWGIVFALDTPTHWAIGNKKLRELILLPALFSLAYGSVMLVDYKIEGHKAHPNVIEQLQHLYPKPKRGAFIAAPPHSPVLLATALLTPQPYRYQPHRYQPYSYPKSNADIVRGWCRDFKAFLDDLIGEQAEEGIIALIALRWMWKVSQNAKDRRLKRKAIERALNPPMPRNIHGDAGFVDRSRAKRQGWI